MAENKVTLAEEAADVAADVAEEAGAADALDEAEDGAQDEGVDETEVGGGPAMVATTRGKWALLGARGGYDYSPQSGLLKTTESPAVHVGTFSYEPIDPVGPLPEIDDAEACAELRCVSICNSEIIKEIADSSNEDAYFVLPSQLNGAEYPSHQSIIYAIDDYRFDGTGGPRGQLAVHPAAGQFILDNAANQGRKDGINAIDQILLHLESVSCPFNLVNGYLEVPLLSDEQRTTATEAFSEMLHTLRPLVMMDVLACGADPGLRMLTDATHRVNLVYASAVPVDTYLNRVRNQGHRDLMYAVAEMCLRAQYYGAMRHAARRSLADGVCRTVYMMPLGGGVFQNPLTIIIRGMSAAVEMLTPDERGAIDIKVLTFHRARREYDEISRLLDSHGKLCRTPAA